MEIDRTLHSVRQVLDGIETWLDISPDSEIPNSPHVLGYLQRLIQDYPFVSSLGVLNSSGQVLSCSCSGQHLNRQVSEIWRVHSVGSLADLYLGKPEQSGGGGQQWNFTVSRAIRRSDGSQGQILFAQIDLDFLQRRFRELFTLPNSTLTIISLDGFVYSRIPTDGLPVGVRIDKNDGMISLEDTPPRGQPAGPLGLNDNLSVVRDLGKYPLQVRVSTAKDTMLGPWRQDSLVVAGVGLAVSLLMLFLTIQAARFHRKQDYTRNSLHQQAITDPLTSIFNRRYVVEQAQLEIKKARRSGAKLSLVLLDLDHFKSVNDRYGHDAGDRVLIATANILKEICRETDIVSRFGGEEFLMVLPDTELAGAMVIAEKVRQAVERKVHHYAGKDFQVTASFGVSQWASGEEDIREVLLRTDDALYQVKSNGRNQIRCAPDQSASYLRGLVSWRYGNV